MNKASAYQRFGFWAMIGSGVLYLLLTAGVINIGDDLAHSLFNSSLLIFLVGAVSRAQGTYLKTKSVPKSLIDVAVPVIAVIGVVIMGSIIIALSAV